MRPIDADAIKLPKGFFEEVDNVPKFYEWLNEQPTIEPKRGRWEDVEEDEGEWICFKCSECGHDAYSYAGEILSNEWRFCPYCGARMERSEDADY